MANLTELTQWEASIYQLETTDPVKGGNDGISNLQAKQLANRTAYLKQQVELKAPLTSPIFTGIPAVPTAAADTNTTQVASTEFVISQAATAAPLVDGNAAVGTSKKYARQDHVHPSDGTRVSIGNLQKGTHIFAVDTGVANAYVCNFTPALDGRGEGQVIRFKVTNTNTGAATINDGVGVVPLVGSAHAALQGGEMVAGGDAWVQWNSTVGTGSYVLLLCTGAPVQLANGTKSQHATALNQITSVVGSARNVAMSVTSASATATLTADEIIVETVLGGLKYQLSNFIKTINLATTGAGGMDTGSAPVSGYVALYVILNTTTGTSALLATNATSVKATEVYSGANMPAGYSASALVSVWPTNASSQFNIGYQADRTVSHQIKSALSTASQTASATLLSISGVVPPNAKSITGFMQLTTSAVANYTGIVAGSLSLVGQQIMNGTSPGGEVRTYPIAQLKLITPQTIYYSCTTGTGTIGFIIYIHGYDF